jgi:hypothetical protein
MIITIKKIILKYSFHIKVFSKYFYYFVTIIQLSKWCRQHPNTKKFNDWFTANSKILTRYDLYEYLSVVIELQNQNINYLEFGVYKGVSLKWWVENNKQPKSRFFGFDTFLGLPEAYRDYPLGFFSTNGKVPQINDPRIEYLKGLFTDTLPAFLKKYSLSSNRIIIHFDADLYSSTLYVLTSMAPFMKKGTILIFDEFAGSFGEHEYRAFSDFISAYRINYEVLGAVSSYMHLAIIIK